MFPSGTADTTTFFRWFQPTKGDHFYTTDPSGEGAPAGGYISEGNIGNIYTKKIAGTVELYRWFQPTKGDHFYTTDPRGENAPAGGYRNEGIAGYVLPV